jgi:hypothetical protein
MRTEAWLLEVERRVDSAFESAGGRAAVEKAMLDSLVYGEGVVVIPSFGTL